MASNPQILVEFIGKTTGLSTALKDTEKQTKGLGGKLGKMGKIAVAAGGAAGLGFLISAVKTGSEEFADAQKITAQTQAVLKSTGKAAHVSAKQIDDLAGSLSSKSGVDDEVIKSGENLLLTFTNIQNKAGKGNKIFDQATKVMLDMSVALGQDTTQSAIQLGKALNDPIKGVTALQRVGVSFTKAQKDQIKALVESGHTMDAQKLILKELNKEFGGSAEAAGKTLPGQLNKLQNSYAELAALLVKTVAPILEDVLKLFNEHPALLKAVVFGVAALAAAMVILNVALAVTAVVTSPITIWFVAAAVAIGVLIAAIVLLVKHFDEIKAAAVDVFEWLKKNWPLILGILTGPFGLAVGEIIKHWDAIKNAATTFGGKILSGLKDGIEGIVDTIRERIVAIKGVIVDAWDNAFNAAKSFGGKILSGVIEGVTGIVADVAAKVRGAFEFSAKLLADALAAGKSLGGSIVSGITGAFEGVAGVLKELVRGAINGVLRLWNALKIPGFKIHINLPKPIPDIDFAWGGLALPNIPLLAKGGVVSRPTVVMAGEGSGREIIAPEALLRRIVQEQVPQVRVFIGDEELRGLVRVEVHRANDRTAQTLLAGLA